MSIHRITLDTNLLLEYWKDRDKQKVVKDLLDLAEKGRLELAVTARIHEDLPMPLLSDRLNNLPELNIEEVGSVTRIGYWEIGRDMLGDEEFENYFSAACNLATKRGNNPPDWRDWDHLHAHYLLHRDIFLTWDKGILCISEELRNIFGIVVKKPEEFLSTLFQ